MSDATPTSEQLRRIVERAERRGVTRYRIATDAGVSKSTLTNILDGSTTNPRVDVVERIAGALGYEVRLTRKV